MSYKIRNRKGVAVDNAIHMAVALFIGVITIFVFALAERSSESKNISSIEKQKEIAYSQGLLTDYLGSIDSSGNTRGSVLAREYEKKEYDSMIRDIKAYFDPKLGHKVYWRIDLEDSKGNKLALTEGGYGKPAQISESASASIPINNKEKEFFKIKLNLGRGLAYAKYK